MVAVFPPLWLHLFSHDADVLREGTTYLRIVAPAYAALGFGFVIAFAAQGAGHVFWPFVASLTRHLCSRPVSAGSRSAISAAAWRRSAAWSQPSLVAYAAICALAMLSAHGLASCET